MIDTHAHLNFEQFDNDLEQVVARALANNVEYIINVGSDVENSLKAIELSLKFDNMFSAVGIHPHDVSKIKGKDFETISGLLLKDKVVALGEVGLDYYRDLSPRDLQKKYVIQFMSLAYKKKKPLIIHCRDAYDDMLKILNSEKFLDIPGVFHCFSGDKFFAKIILDKGFFVSFAGQITFPKAEALREIVEYIPLDRILIETDCPYLAPQAYRGQRNEPAYIVECAKKIAQIKNVDFDEVDRVTTFNAKKVFNMAWHTDDAMAHG